MTSLRSRSLALLVAGAFFMEFLDGTVIATAIPKMAVSFGVRPVDLGIGMSAYLLTLAILLPLSGWIADRYGPRRVFVMALVTFTSASLLCAVSPGLLFFVAARILQGVGGAMMVPVGRLAVLRTTAKSDLIRAIATLTWPALVAPILAPPIGGFITTYASWRWIFLINLPLGLIGIILSTKLMPAEGDTSRRPLDWIGFAGAAVACFALMTGVEAAGRETIDWGLVAGLFTGSAVFAVFSVGWALRHPTPLLDLRSLSVRSFAASLGGGSLARIAISAVPFLLPLLFQVGFGYDAFHSGLLVLVLFIGNIAMKPATTPILRRFGFKPVLVGNGLLAAAAIAACAAITPTTPLWATVLILLFQGATRSMQMTAFNTFAFADIPSERMSGANTLLSMVQQMSFGMGVTVGALALRFAEIWRPAGMASATPPEFQIAFLMIGLVALASVADALPLPADVAAHVSRSR